MRLISFIAVLSLLSSCMGTCDGENGFDGEVRNVSTEFVLNVFENDELRTIDDVMRNSSRLSLNEEQSLTDLGVRVLTFIEVPQRESSFRISLFESANACNPAEPLKNGIKRIRIFTNQFISDSFPSGSDISSFFSYSSYEFPYGRDKSLIPLEEEFPGEIDGIVGQIPIAILILDSDSILEAGDWSFTVEVELDDEMTFSATTEVIQLN